jgi:hypothetical protein
MFWLTTATPISEDRVVTVRDGVLRVLEDSGLSG